MSMQHHTLPITIAYWAGNPSILLIEGALSCHTAVPDWNSVDRYCVDRHNGNGDRHSSNGNPSSSTARQNSNSNPPNFPPGLGFVSASGGASSGSHSSKNPPPPSHGEKKFALSLDNIGSVQPPPGLISPGANGGFEGDINAGYISGYSSKNLVLVCSNVPCSMSPATFCEWMNMRTNVFYYTRVLHGVVPGEYLMMIALKAAITPRQV